LAEANEGVEGQRQHESEMKASNLWTTIKSAAGDRSGWKKVVSTRHPQVLKDSKKKKNI
ncbi:jg3140, partial [Pararge aegeria aegeria]